MKTKLSNILIGLQAAAALCALGAIKIWAPVCDKMLDLANGNQTHMKCFYAGQAAAAMAVIVLVAAVMAFLTKKDHKQLMALGMVAAVMLFLLFGTVMGICASDAMACRSTAVWVRGAAVISFAASLIELLRGKEGQLPG